MLSLVAEPAFRLSYRFVGARKHAVKEERELVMKSRKQIHSGWVFVTLFSLGCGAQAPEPSDLVCPAPESAVMGVVAPDGVKYKYVNQASFTAENGSVRVKLADTTVTMNQGGGFSDETCSSPSARNGNKAFIGFTGHSGRLVSDLVAFTYTVTPHDTKNGAAVSPYFLVDCDGDGVQDTVVIAMFGAPQLQISAQPQDVPFTARFEPEQSIYVTSSGDGCGGRIPSFRDSTKMPQPLTALPATAQFIDARPVADCGMPRCTIMPAIGVSDGDSRATMPTDLSFGPAVIEWHGEAPRTYHFGH